MSNSVFDVTGKRLLILGGTSSADIVKQAKRMGVYVVVADIEETDPGKEMADEAVFMNTVDYETIVKFIKENNIDGVFSGPSEFNLQNAMRVCEMSGLPFYCTREQWDICMNKVSFKKLCNQYGVPCTPEYYLTEELKEEDLAAMKYPVMVKPAEAGGSRGISMCYTEEELRRAVPKAIKASANGEFFVEKCITSDYGFGSRYIINNGKVILSAVCDRYTVDQPGGKALISSGAIFPSKKIQEYIDEINPQVVKMYESIGIKNGTLFMQALVDQVDGKIYFHEMGLRLSGGLIFSMLEASCGYNDVQMMIRYALGGPMVEDDEIEKIDPYMHGHYIGSLTIPLCAGVVGSIEGVDEVRKHKNVMDLVQYYTEGQEIRPDYIGTLSQHFCRVKMMTDSIDEYKNMVDWIQSTIKVTDSNGRNMIYRLFDTSRMK